MYKIMVLGFLVAFLIACDSDADTGEFVVGSDYLSVNNKIIQIDTLTATMSTINIDSLITSNQSRILIGNYEDPIFGKLKAEGYFQISNASGDYAIGSSSTSDTESSTYVFDSISIVLKYDNYFFGDTTKVQTIDIHRLTQQVKPNTEDSNFYNNSKLSYESQSLGSYSYKPRPTDKDSLHIRLNDDFGKALFLRLKNNEITDFDKFTEYFKGIAIIPNTTNSSCIIGFNLSSEVRLYYSKNSSVAEESIMKSFTIGDVTKQFNAISSDKTGTAIQNLSFSSIALSSTLCGNRGFIQSGSGVACRIDFPNIKELNSVSDNGAIVYALLTIKPVNNSYSDLYSLPDSLQVYVADKLNRISGTLNDLEDLPMYAVLNKNKDEFNENVQYTLPIGGFLLKEMIKKSDSRSSLILTTPNYKKEVSRVVLGDQNLVSNKMELKIYYLTY